MHPGAWSFTANVSVKKWDRSKEKKLPTWNPDLYPTSIASSWPLIPVLQSAHNSFCSAQTSLQAFLNKGITISAIIEDTSYMLYIQRCTYLLKIFNSVTGFQGKKSWSIIHAAILWYFINYTQFIKHTDFSITLSMTNFRLHRLMVLKIMVLQHFIVLELQDLKTG